jgi:hypothetical protein
MQKPRKHQNDKYAIQIQEDDLDQIHSIEFINSLCIIRKSISRNNYLGPRVVIGDIAKIDANWKKLNGTKSPTPNQDNNLSHVFSSNHL